jgi:hypothetical protein
MVEAESWLSRMTAPQASRAETSAAFKGETRPHSELDEDRIKALNIDKRRFKYGRPCPF